MEHFQAIKPSRFLAPYVKLYWFLQAGNISHLPQRIIPTGCMDLMFHRGDRMLSLQDGDLQARSFLCGQSAGYCDLLPTGAVDMISVTFHPAGAKAFFPMPMSELNETSVSVDALGDRALTELEDRLANTSGNDACVSLIESFLLKRLYLSKEYNHKRMLAVVKVVNEGQTDIATLSQVSCLGYKQFQRLFNEYVGANPKDFLRVIRFQRALYILQHQPQMMLTQLALECGYYDQSHLIKEFKAFSGHTPSEYIAICPPYSDYFS